MLTNKEIKIIEEKINYTFNNKELLKKAFTHTKNNVLSFTGDGVIQFIITKDQAQYINEEGASEHLFTVYRQQIINNENLAKAITKLNLIKYLITEYKDVYNSNAVKASLLQAIIGAIDIDSKSNFDVLNQVIKTMLGYKATYIPPQVDLQTIIDYINANQNSNPITVVQELFQHKYIKEPIYLYDVTYDENGNPLWKAILKTATFNIIVESEIHTNKTKARQDVATKLLNILIDTEE